MTADVITPSGSGSIGDSTAGPVAGETEFARNLIGGRWRFPAAPYEFEIRSPRDSTVIGCVPLSSRFDVAAAVQAARDAAPAWASDPALRASVVSRAIAGLDRHGVAVAERVAAETGLDLADAGEQVRTAAAWARHWVAGAAVQDAAGPQPTGVAGIVLGWGAPLLEAVAGLLPPLLSGHPVVVKPSLRAPMSAVLLARLLVRAGLPDGVLNLVQGTGTDVGAALIGRTDLALLHVRGGERTLDQAARATASTRVPLRALRGGGNVLLSGRDADAATVAATVAAALRLHNTGGPTALPLLVTHADTAGQVVDAVLAAVCSTTPAPLPTEPVRARALRAVADLVGLGARVLTGGSVPDDVPHRMGWLLPPTVVAVGAVGNRLGPRSATDPWREPLGPVIVVSTWRTVEDLAGTFAHARFADGITWTHRLDRDALQQVTGVSREVSAARHVVEASDLSPAWTAGIAAGDLR